MTRLIILLALLLALYWAWRVSRHRRRARLLALPFPPPWREILKRNVPLMRRLRADQREALESRIQRFLLDMTFEGCGGLTIDDALRVIDVPVRLDPSCRHRSGRRKDQLGAGGFEFFDHLAQLSGAVSLHHAFVLFALGV